MLFQYSLQDIVTGERGQIAVEGGGKAAQAE